MLWKRTAITQGLEFGRMVTVGAHTAHGSSQLSLQIVGSPAGEELAVLEIKVFA